MSKIIYFFLNFVRSSRFLTKFIWGIKIKKKIHDTFWDLTSLVLKKELKIIKNKKKFLDMGCGQFAILGQFFKKRNLNSEVISVDLYDKFISNSISTIKLNNLEIKVIQSNLFSNLSGKKFDLISFNPPYVPSSRDNIEKNYKKIRYSGSDGLLITSKFLDQSKKHLTPAGEIIIGINTFYVNENKCKKLFLKKSLKIEKIIRMRLNTSVVFKLKFI